MKSFSFLKVIFIFLILLCNCSVFAQNAKFVQKLEWSESKNSANYKVEILPEDNSSASLFYVTKNTFIEVSLPSGFYKYRVYVYDLLGRESSVSSWHSFEVRKAVKPNIISVEEKVDINIEENEVSIPVDIKSVNSDSSVVLVNTDTGKEISGKLVLKNQNETSYGQASFATFESVEEGQWKVVITNPGGLYSESQILEIKNKSESETEPEESSSEETNQASETEIETEKLPEIEENLPETEEKESQKTSEKSDESVDETSKSEESETEELEVEETEVEETEVEETEVEETEVEEPKVEETEEPEIETEKLLEIEGNLLETEETESQETSDKSDESVDETSKSEESETEDLEVEEPKLDEPEKTEVGEPKVVETEEPEVEEPKVEESKEPEIETEKLPEVEENLPETEESESQEKLPYNVKGFSLMSGIGITWMPSFDAFGLHLYGTGYNPNVSLAFEFVPATDKTIDFGAEVKASEFMFSSETPFAYEFYFTTVNFDFIMRCNFIKEKLALDVKAGAGVALINTYTNIDGPVYHDYGYIDAMGGLSLVWTPLKFMQVEAGVDVNMYFIPDMFTTAVVPYAALGVRF